MKKEAQLLEYADRLSELAGQTRRGEVSYYGSAEHLAERGATLRATAAELLDRLPT